MAPALQRWAKERSDCIEGNGEAWSLLEEVQLLDKRKFKSVESAVIALNQGQVSCPEYCVVFSDRYKHYYFLWPSEKSSKEVFEFIASVKSGARHRQLLSKGTSNDAKSVGSLSSRSTPCGGTPYVDGVRQVESTPVPPLIPLVDHVSRGNRLSPIISHRDVVATKKLEFAPKVESPRTIRSRQKSQKKAEGQSGELKENEQEESWFEIFLSLFECVSREKDTEPVTIDIRHSPRNGTDEPLPKEPAAVGKANWAADATIKRSGDLDPFSQKSVQRQDTWPGLPPKIPGRQHSSPSPSRSKPTRSISSASAISAASSGRAPKMIGYLGDSGTSGLLFKPARTHSSRGSASSTASQSWQPGTGYNTPASPSESARSADFCSARTSQSLKSSVSLSSFGGSSARSQNPVAGGVKQRAGAGPGNHYHDRRILRQPQLSMRAPVPDKAAFVHVSKMKVDEMWIDDDTFDLESNDLRVQIITKLGNKDAGPFEAMQDVSGRHIDDVWTLAIPGTHGLVLKLGSEEDTHKFLKVQSLCPDATRDLALTFPVKILQLRGPVGNRLRDLVVMRRAPGLRLTEIIDRKWSGGEKASLRQIIQEFGAFLCIVHQVYNGFQHGNCLPAKVFYDEAASAFTLTGVANFGASCSEGEDAKRFIDGLKTLGRQYGKDFVTDAVSKFNAGYEEQLRES